MTIIKKKLERQKSLCEAYGRPLILLNHSEEALSGSVRFILQYQTHGNTVALHGIVIKPGNCYANDSDI